MWNSVPKLIESHFSAKFSAPAKIGCKKHSGEDFSTSSHFALLFIRLLVFSLFRFFLHFHKNNPLCHDKKKLSVNKALSE